MKGVQRALRDSTTRRDSWFGDLLPGKAGSDVERAKKAVDEIQAKIDANRRKSDETAANLNSREIGNLLRGLNPDQQRLEEMSTTAEKLRKALSDPIKWGLDLADLYRTNQAVGDLSRKFQAMTEDIDKFGSTAVAAMNRTANLANRTVGFSPSAKSAAEINDRFDQLERTADSRELAGLRRARSTELDTLNKGTTLDLNRAGGAFSRLSPEVQRQLIAVSQMPQYGMIPPSIIAGITKPESSGNLGVGFSKALGEDGRPSSAYGLGQITKGTAGAAVRGGYLPPGFDRMDQSTMVQGIAGVLAMKYAANGGDIDRAIMAYRGSKDPNVNRSYLAEVKRAAGEMGDTSALGQAKDVDALARAQRDAGQNVKNLTDFYGRNGQALELAQARQQKYNELIDRGVTAADAASIAFGGMTDKIVMAGRSAREIQFTRDLDFERDQLGRSAGDQSAFARARAAFGDTSSDPARAAIERIRELDMLKDARGTFQDTFGGVVSSLSRGATAAQVANQALTKFGDKLINFGTDALGGLLFGGGGKGGSGVFGGLVGSILGGAGGVDVGGASWMPKFADGGIMTSEGPLQLHRYAIGGIANSPQMAIFGEGRGLEAFVPLPDGRRIPVAMTGGAANGNASYTNAPTISIDARGSTLTEDQIRGVVVQALATNNQERDRTQFERSEAYRRMAG